MLLQIANLRTLARDANIARIDAGPSAIAFTPRSLISKRVITAANLVEKGDRLVLSASIASEIDRLACMEKVLRQLAGAPRRA